ncbi:MAG: undecaprenyl-diphosphate phosphatase [Firmicutes bacterium]|nr:undecaprenyl-diphosphate phosphatase [Bacillota bacterium]
MSWFTALVLGIVQGLTEFIPVSSSGHLVLLQRWFGLSGDLVLFDLCLHLGTALAVAAVLFREILGLFKRPKELGLLALSCVPTVALVLVFYGFFKSTFDGRYLALCFLATAVLLTATDLFAGNKRLLGAKNLYSQNEKAGFAMDFCAGQGMPTKQYSCGIARRLNANRHKKTRKDAFEFVNTGSKIGFWTALTMGAAQGLAVLPGLSRSGTTVAAGSLVGADRGKAAKFSFLMSLPVIVGSSVFEAARAGGLTSAGAGAAPLLTGTAAAFVCGVLAVKFMLKIFSERRLYGFSVYLVLLAVVTFLSINLDLF